MLVTVEKTRLSRPNLCVRADMRLIVINSALADRYGLDKFRYAELRVDTDEVDIKTCEGTPKTLGIRFTNRLIKGAHKVRKSSNGGVVISTTGWSDTFDVFNRLGLQKVNDYGIPTWLKEESMFVVRLDEPVWQTNERLRKARQPMVVELTSRRKKAPKATKRLEVAA